MEISIIMPVLNEQRMLTKNLPLLKRRFGDFAPELILVDGGSEDSSVAKAKEMGWKVVRSPITNRGFQMNLGAEKARSDLLYFLHADTLPPRDFLRLITESVNRGNDFGMFAYKFEPSDFLLSLNAYFTKYENMFAGGGDQSLFIRKAVFESMGGFDDSMPIMEDFDLFKRAKKEYKYSILPDRMIVSSRKYEGKNYFRIQLINFYTFLSYKMGADLDLLAKRYKRWVSQ